MKKTVIACFLALTMLFGLSACKSAQEPATEQTQASANQEQEATQVPSQTEKGKTLVVYFSATGTTKAVAEKIAAVTNADMYEIKAAKAYTTADLDWNDKNSRSTIEQNDTSARPEIGSEALSVEGYTRVYIGYPIWWGEEPRIMDTFVESHQFDGIEMIPFCTSGSSGIAKSGKNLEQLAGTGTWREGKRFGSNASEAEVQEWIAGLK